MVKEKWEDEFDKRTEWNNVEGINFSYDYELGIFRNPLEALKDFISKVIQQARQEERELIKEKIEEKQKILKLEQFTINTIINIINKE